MGRFDNIKTAIDTNINTNGNQAITGAVMNSVMKQTVEAFDSQYIELESNSSQDLTSLLLAGRCAVTGVVGDVASINRIPGSTVWKYMLIYVEKGQRFLITSRGTPDTPSWVIIDSDKKIVGKASENRQENVIVEALTDGYLIMNAYIDDSYYKDVDYSILFINPVVLSADIDHVCNWILSESYQVVNAERDASDNVIAASIIFPNGVPSTMTIQRNAEGLVTKVSGNYGSKRVYTYTIQRNAEGEVTQTSFNNSIHVNNW